MIHRARKKRKKKFLIFQLSKFSRENFSRIFEERSINNSSKVANIKKKKESRKMMAAATTASRFIIPSPILSIRVIRIRTRWTAQSVTCEILANLYIYINTVKLEILWKRGKWRKWIKRKKKKYRILN